MLNPRDSERLGAESGQDERLVWRVRPVPCDAPSLDQALRDQRGQRFIPTPLAIAHMAKRTKLWTTEHTHAKGSPKAQRFLAQHSSAQAGLTIGTAAELGSPGDRLQHRELGVDKQFGVGYQVIRQRRPWGSLAVADVARDDPAARAISDLIAEMPPDGYAGIPTGSGRSRSWR